MTTVYGKTTPVYDMGKARSMMNDTALYMVIVFLISYREPDIPLDVTTVYGKTTPVYDMGKARSVMNDTALYMVIDTVLDFLQRTRYTPRCNYSIC